MNWLWSIEIKLINVWVNWKRNIALEVHNFMSIYTTLTVFRTKSEVHYVHRTAQSIWNDPAPCIALLCSSETHNKQLLIRVTLYEVVSCRCRIWSCGLIRSHPFWVTTFSFSNKVADCEWLTELTGYVLCMLCLCVCVCVCVCIYIYRMRQKEHPDLGVA